ncbi:hypothetical protein [Natrinema saccharevitans]|uniref:hypothetical protein n=1 Tax=Natrinema saccharevitans TaxID=301967 RepID=UPI001115811C|nr:hypothetical protein [Natrinema saccharevitans]
MDGDYNVKRRNVMKAATTSVVGLSSFPTVLGAKPSGRYVGVAYDPTTHEILGSASGKFNSTQRKLRGNLRVSGEEINMSSGLTPERKISNKGFITSNFEKVDKIGIAKKSQEENKGKDRQIKTPRKITILAQDDKSLTGVVRTPERERIAFSISKSSNNTRHDVEEVVKKYAPTKEKDLLTDSIENRGTKLTTQAGGCDTGNCDDSRYEVLDYRRTHSAIGEVEGQYKYCTYLTADAENGHDPDQVRTWNRWNVQRFYSETPDPSEDQYDDCNYGTPCHVMSPISMRFNIDVSYNRGYQNNNAYVSELNPGENHDNGDEFNFGISIGAGYGIISAGWSISKNGNAQSPEINQPHREIEWDYPIDFFPREQTNSRGVYFNVHGGEENREEEFEIVAETDWQILELGTDGSRVGVFSTADQHSLHPKFEVLESG